MQGDCAEPPPNEFFAQSIEQRFTDPADRVPVPPGACVIFSDDDPFRSSPGSLYLSNLYLLTDSLPQSGGDNGVGDPANMLYITHSVVTSNSICLDFIFYLFAEGAFHAFGLVVCCQRVEWRPFCGVQCGAGASVDPRAQGCVILQRKDLDHQQTPDSSSDFWCLLVVQMVSLKDHSAPCAGPHTAAPVPLCTPQSGPFPPAAAPVKFGKRQIMAQRPKSPTA